MIPSQCTSYSCYLNLFSIQQSLFKKAFLINLTSFLGELYTASQTEINLRYLLKDIDALKDDLLELKPTFLAAVPRVLERMHEGMYLFVFIIS